MTKKSLGAKLARGVHRARQQAPAKVTKAVPVAPPRVARNTRPAKQSSSTSIDSPWANLHPERIWPD